MDTLVLSPNVVSIENFRQILSVGSCSFVREKEGGWGEASALLALNQRMLRTFICSGELAIHS